jgi:hypothetical protein
MFNLGLNWNMKTGRPFYTLLEGCTNISFYIKQFRLVKNLLPFKWQHLKTAQIV